MKKKKEKVLYTATICDIGSIYSAQHLVHQVPPLPPVSTGANFGARPKRQRQVLHGCSSGAQRLLGISALLSKGRWDRVQRQAGLGSLVTWR